MASLKWYSWIGKEINQDNSVFVDFKDIVNFALSLHADFSPYNRPPDTARQELGVLKCEGRDYVKK